ncbi:hypothetical protein ACFSOX_16230 [Rhodoplanes azumiensis]|uniref:Uncharacterized protein n=1 Tax=Rhodoplanes azumiensis TaxID=1897628 RepID=A0ABW5ANE6_9BRAD
MAREQRLAAALRDNLKRRKMQSRARRAPEAADPPAAAGLPEATGLTTAPGAVDPCDRAAPAETGGQACGTAAPAEPHGSESHDSAGIVTEKQSGIDG